MREPSTNIGWLTHAHTNAQVTQLTYHCPSNYSKDIHHAQLVPEIWKRFLMLLWKDPSTDHGLDVAICSSLQVSHKMIITFIVFGSSKSWVYSLLLLHHKISSWASYWKSTSSTRQISPIVWVIPVLHFYTRSYHQIFYFLLPLTQLSPSKVQKS